MQAARGGANPAIRTLFYRLVRLLSLPIRPIFVFDGPNKPLFKRNKRSAARGDGLATAMAKRLINLFGFHVHNAPGEAEAECALLQQQGVVDAVLSEDVDTIMFGCTRTLRNWSADGVKGSKTPTHVSMYETANLSLDREGMVLVALMSGGDYLPEGVPGCGVKVACEAARGGMGKSLCRLRASDSAALASWREGLLHELRTNESGFFRTRHNALSIPETFPNVEVLRYYTHPVVSQSATVEKLKGEFCDTQPRPVQVAALRQFVGETFDWNYRNGAVKLIRVLAPSLLAQKMLAGAAEDAVRGIDAVQEAEAAIAHGVTMRRNHFSTDSTPELRISYTPANMVDGITLGDELEEEVPVYGRDGLALNDDEFDEEIAEDAGKNGRKAFDPLEPDVVWIPETVAKLGIPLTVEDWEEKQRAKQQARLAPKAPKGRNTKQTTGTSKAGALSTYLKTTKIVAAGSSQSKPSSSKQPSSPSQPLFSKAGGSQASKQPPTAPRSKQPPKPGAGKRRGNGAAQPELSSQTNPWTLASSPSRPRAPPAAAASPAVPSAAPSEAIIIPSSPSVPVAAAASPPLKEHAGTPSSPSSPPAPAGLGSDPFSSPAAKGPRAQALPRKAPAQAKTGKDASPTKSQTRTRRAPRKEEALPSSQLSIRTFAVLRERSTVIELASSPPPAKEARPARAASDDDDLPSLSSLLSGRRSGAKRNDDDEAELPPASAALETVAAPGAGMTRLYMPRTSDAGCGYFKEVEVSRDEADRLIAQAGGRGKAAIWRRSEVSVVDLTGED